MTTLSRPEAEARAKSFYDACLLAGTASALFHLPVAVEWGALPDGIRTRLVATMRHMEDVAPPADEVERVARITLDLDATITPAGRWYVATGCSWRRVLIEGTDEAVLMPCVAKDGQPDISGIANLEAACAMRDAAPVLARAVLAAAETRKVARALLEVLDTYETAADGSDLSAYYAPGGEHFDNIIAAKIALRVALGKEGA